MKSATDRAIKPDAEKDTEPDTEPDNEQVTEVADADDPVEVDADIEADTDADSDEPRRPWRLAGRLPQLLLAVAVALVVATAAVAIWFGVAWFRAAGDDSLDYSGVRDEVNRVGQAAVITMNTLDYRHVDQGLGDWETATTGALHDEVVNLKEQSKQTIVQAESVTKATVLSSAVRELDERAGKAVIMVAIKVNVTTKGAEPTDKYQRIEGSLQRTDAGWKLDGIAQVPYTQAGK